MFVRAKKIKGNQYYYVCESARKNEKVEQIVRAYLGSFKKASQRIKVLYKGDVQLRLLQRLEHLHQKSTTRGE